MPGLSCVRLLVVAVLAVATVSCSSGPPKGVLNPVAVPPGTDLESIYVATTRAKPANDPVEMFDGNRSKVVQYAHLIVSIPPNHKPGEIEWPRSVPGDPTANFVTAQREYLLPDAFVADVRKAIASRPPKDRDILVFIHGYNTRFEEAVYRLAQIVHDSGFKGVPVLFTWPSRGALLAYPYDRESAVFSRDYLESTLRELARKSGASRIDVLAHSMGNFLFMETLRQAVIRGDGRFGGKLGQVMLAAPDIDIDVFKRQMSVIAPLHIPITVFVSRDDKALNISKMVWQSDARAGSLVVTDPETLEKMKEANITSIDLSDVKSDDSLNHGKFASSPDVVKLIGNRLAQDGGIKGRDPTLGDNIVGIGGALGRTVGGVAALPVKVLEGTAQGVAEGADAPAQ